MPGIGAQITTVMVAAANYDFVTLATAKLLLNITDSLNDAYLSLVITQASAEVAQYCNDNLAVETLQSQFFPQRDGWPGVARGGKDVLQVRRIPVLAVASVVETIGGVVTPLVLGTDYLADLPRGQIIRLDADGYPVAWAANPVVLTYSAGYSPIPPDIADATVRLVKAAWFARMRDPMVRSQKADGIFEESYWFGAGPGNSGGMPPDVERLLSNYCVPVFG